MLYFNIQIPLNPFTKQNINVMSLFVGVQAFDFSCNEIFFSCQFIKGKLIVSLMLSHLTVFTFIYRNAIAIVLGQVCLN